MKVLIIGSVEPSLGGKSAGGVNSHILDLAENLRNKNIDVAIAAINTHNSEKYIYYRNIKIYYFPKIIKMIKNSIFDLLINLANFKIIKYTGFCGIKRAFILNAQAFTLNIIIKDFKPDLIHNHALILYPIVNNIAKNIPIVNTIHSFHSFEPSFVSSKIERKIQKRMAEKSLKKLNNVITVSYYMKKEISKLFNGKIYVINNPVNISKNYTIMQNKYNLNKGKNLVFIGNLIERKGVIDLIEIANIIRKELLFNLIIIGEGNLKENMVKLISKNNLSEYITFTGEIPHKEVYNYLDNADLFILPSYNETWGLVFFEAFSKGVPIVAYDNSVMREVIPEFAGILAKNKDISDFANKVVLALNIDWNREEIIRYAEKYSWKNRINDYICVYNETLKECN
jgi:glycosyltransferase involved in cell wall biosynthesis